MLGAHRALKWKVHIPAPYNPPLSPEFSFIWLVVSRLATLPPPPLIGTQRCLRSPVYRHQGTRGMGPGWTQEVDWQWDLGRGRGRVGEEL